MRPFFELRRLRLARRFFAFRRCAWCDTKFFSRRAKVMHESEHAFGATRSAPRQTYYVTTSQGDWRGTYGSYGV